MAVRLIDVYIPRDKWSALRKMLENRPVHNVWQETMLENRLHVRILTDAGRTEELLDLMQGSFGLNDGFRVIVSGVEAVIPAIKKPDEPENGETCRPRAAARVSRQEIYNDIAEGVEFSGIFVLMVVLSTILAAVGLAKSNVAVIIGAMVIAPLLGPNVAMALATTLGDFKLIKKAMKITVVGLSVSFALSSAAGIIFSSSVDPSTPEILVRTNVGIGDVALALAAGCAGVLAFTSAVPSALIGVMVAVALLPPFVAAGMLTGAGHMERAYGASLMFLVNLICINLSGVVTFLFMGIRPLSWWDSDRASRASRTAILLWTLLLAALVALILLSGGTA